MMKHKFNDEGSIKSNMLTIDMRLNSKTIPLDSSVATGVKIRCAGPARQLVHCRGLHGFSIYL